MEWKELVRHTVVSPRRAARDLLSRRIGRGILAQGAIAVSASGILLAYAAMEAAGGAVDAMSAALLSAPLIAAAIQLAVMSAVAWLTWQVGRLFGGTGSLAGAFALVIWLNAVMVVIQAVQLGALLIVPPLAAVLALATLAWVLWAFASFVTELHGFQNTGFVLGGVLLTMIVLFFGFGIALAMLGIGPRETM